MGFSDLRDEKERRGPWLTHRRTGPHLSARIQIPTEAQKVVSRAQNCDNGHWKSQVEGGGKFYLALDFTKGLILVKGVGFRGWGGKGAFTINQEERQTQAGVDSSPKNYSHSTQCLRTETRPFRQTKEMGALYRVASPIRSLTFSRLHSLSRIIRADRPETGERAHGNRQNTSREGEHHVEN